jgi:hypothetical protein
MNRMCAATRSYRSAGVGLPRLRFLEFPLFIFNIRKFLPMDTGRRRARQGTELAAGHPKKQQSSIDQTEAFSV